MSSSTHCLRAHCHFISITLRAVAGTVNSTERRSIQLNNQWAGENQQSITVASLNGWVYWLACVCSCCQACGVFWGHKGQRQARGKAYCVKSDTAGLPRMVVRLTVCQGHISLWPAMAFGKPCLPAVINCPELSIKQGRHFMHYCYSLLSKSESWMLFSRPPLTTWRLKRKCSVH